MLSPPARPRPLAGLAATHWPVLLVWSCLLLLPFGRLVEVPVLVMALAGLVVLARRWRTWIASARLRLLALVFAAVWIPVLLSLPDAVDPHATARIALNHLRFLLAGIFVLHALPAPAQHALLLRLCGWTLAVWVVDGLVQWAIGVDLLGFEPPGGRINGLFGQHALVFGLLLAVLCGLLLEHARRAWPPWAPWAGAAACGLLVLMAGTRSAWISLAVVGLAYAGRAWRRTGRLPLGALAAVGVLTAGGLLVAYQTSPWVAQRVDTGVDVLAGTGDPVQNSLRHRFWIWRVALRTFAAHPVNGVGARGFREAYPAHTTDDDPYLALPEPQSPTHTHQLWLEVLAETGAIGALGLLLVHALVIHAFWRASPATRRTMGPYALCLLVACFPLNTHMAIYSAFWSQVLWWLIALTCAACTERTPRSQSVEGA